ncbi:MAG: response regulator transcription factor, partial [Acidobacteriota bacterium]
IILDVMLPKMSGLDVCQQLRHAGDDVPIIMLTARGQEVDKILGLKLGADDYVTKPFSFLELAARAEALLRRSSGSLDKSSGTGPLTTYRFGDVQVDFGRHAAHKAGRPLSLTPRELRLLEFFVRHRGEVVSRDQLLDAVWGYDHMPFTRTVDTHIAKLRKKIEAAPADPDYLITVHRLGYKFIG